MPEAFAELKRIADQVGTALPRHAGRRIHRAGRQAVDAANAQRQAHGEGRARTAVDMVKEKLISKEEAVARVDPSALDQLLHPTLDPNAKQRRHRLRPCRIAGRRHRRSRVHGGRSREARPATGATSFWCALETSPEDIHGMHAAQGILTARGGMTSHAAVVARGMGRPCVSGAGALKIDVARGDDERGQPSPSRAARSSPSMARPARFMQGPCADVQPELTGDFGTLMEWADEVPQPESAHQRRHAHRCETARKFGAEGIGLCRTEHMFFDADRIVAVREMILADDEKGRNAALAKLLPMQRGDFEAIFRIMAGLPVTIRLLDPPLHEFLPHNDEEIDRSSQGHGHRCGPIARARHRAARGQPHAGPSRLPAGHHLSRNLRNAGACHLRSGCWNASDAGNPVQLEIMIPLVGFKSELDFLQRPHRGRRGRSGKGTWQKARLSSWHNDRAAARGAACGRNRAIGRILLLRYQRSDTDNVGRFPRRRGHRFSASTSRVV